MDRTLQHRLAGWSPRALGILVMACGWMHFVVPSILAVISHYCFAHPLARAMLHEHDYLVVLVFGTAPPYVITLLCLRRLSRVVSLNVILIGLVIAILPRFYLSPQDHGGIFRETLTLQLCLFGFAAIIFRPIHPRGDKE